MIAFRVMRLSILAATGLCALLLSENASSQATFSAHSAPRRTPSKLAPATGFQRLLENLRHADFRVRTQAVLALGASANPRAERPLCQSLSDRSAPVRAAAAAALGRLAKGGLLCLEDRHAIESSKTVRLAIERAAESIFDAFRIKDETRFYLAIDPLADQSKRPRTANFPRLVRTAMLNTGRTFPGWAFAPAWETLELARKRLAARPALRAFSLSPRLPPFEYSGGDLLAQLEIVMLTHPGSSLIGTFTVRLTQSDVLAEDPSSEKELVKMAAERAVQKFVKLAPGL